MVYSDTFLNNFQRISLLKLTVSFAMKFHICDGKWKTHAN